VSTQFLGDKKDLAAQAAQEDREEAAELEVEGLVEAVPSRRRQTSATWKGNTIALKY
jgi:hypothetical protein